MIIPITDYRVNNSSSFMAKRFRIPIRNIVYSLHGMTLFSKKSNAVKEYSNPCAAELYSLAQQSKDINEKVRLYSDMGHYEIVSMAAKEKIKTFLRLPLP